MGIIKYTNSGIEGEISGEVVFIPKGVSVVTEFSGDFTSIHIPAGATLDLSEICTKITVTNGRMSTNRKARRRP
jgi:hypothetical protein